MKSLVEHREWIRCVRPNADGSLLASCSNDQEVRVWTLSAGVRDCKPLAVLHGHEHVVECVAWLNSSPQNAKAIAAGTGNRTENGEFQPQTLQLNGDDPTSSDYVPIILASGARDRQICIWDVRASSLIFVLVCVHLYHHCLNQLCAGCDSETDTFALISKCSNVFL